MAMAAAASIVALDEVDLERRFGGLRRLYGDAGYTRVNGICVRVLRPADPPPPNDPAKALVAPMPFR